MMTGSISHNFTKFRLNLFVVYFSLTKSLASIHKCICVRVCCMHVFACLLCVHCVSVCEVSKRRHVCLCVDVLFSFVGRSISVWVDEEAREGAVLVLVSSVDLSSIQLNTHLIADVQMQDHTVGGIVVILISILSDGACSYLSPIEDIHSGS